MNALIPLLSLVCLLAAAAAQAPPAPPEPKAPAAWPALRDADKARVLALVGQFRKSDPKLHEAASKELKALGAGAAPLVMQQVSDRAADVNAHLFAVLEAIVAPEHGPLLAKEAGKPGVELRRWLAGRLCRLHDPQSVRALESLRTDADPATAFHAQLGLLAQRRRDALPAVLAHARTNWAEVGPVVAEVLPAARSGECALWVFEAIASAPAAEQMTGLRLLRHLMTREQGMLLRTYLQASDHTVKREAVNTARVLHGEPPIENLTVFQAIEQAKQWLEKL